LVVGASLKTVKIALIDGNFPPANSEIIILPLDDV
jgi:hypothetical protein